MPSFKLCPLPPPRASITLHNESVADALRWGLCSLQRRKPLKFYRNDPDVQGRSHTLQIPDRRLGFPSADTVVAPGRSRTQLTKRNKTAIRTLTTMCPTSTSSQHLNPHLDGKGQTLDSENVIIKLCFTTSH